MLYQGIPVSRRIQKLITTNIIKQHTAESHILMHKTPEFEAAPTTDTPSDDRFSLAKPERQHRCLLAPLANKNRN